MGNNIRHIRELDVYKQATMEIFELTKSFPAEERYSVREDEADYA